MFFVVGFDLFGTVFLRELHGSHFEGGGQPAPSVAWGDAWTNLLQPFWALPVLAIAGLKAKDIMGFCLIQLFITGIIISAGLVWF